MSIFEGSVSLSLITIFFLLKQGDCIVSLILEMSVSLQIGIYTNVVIFVRTSIGQYVDYKLDRHWTPMVS
jgi:hypothetical protein